MNSITLTLNIQISKKSAVNKLQKASKTFQHFKNLVYITALEYFKHTKSIKPFLSVSFLEKYIKGKERLPFENEKIREIQIQLINLWQTQIGSDTVKVLVNVLVREFKSIVEKWKKGEKVREQFLKLPNWLDKLSRPIKLNLFGKYSASVLEDIADSISLSNDRRRTLSETFC